MFLGHFETKFDIQKGRTALPSTFRKKINGRAIITKGFEKSLLLVKFSDWEKVIEKVSQESFLSGLSRQTDRFLLGNAFELSFDSQGRFIVPVKLREYASFGKEIYFVGVGSKVEIWDKKRWDKNDKYLYNNITQISEELYEKSNR